MRRVRNLVWLLSRISRRGYHYQAHKRVEKPPLRVGDVKYKIVTGVWENSMRAEFKGLVGLNAFEFVELVHDGVNVVSA